MRQCATISTIPAFAPQRTYRYGYDSLSRLTEARYSDSEGGAGRYDTRYDYDLNGNVTSLVRRGALSLSSAGTPSAYGAIDSLTLEYAGNRLRSVSDAAAGPHYQGAFHFVDGADKDVEYSYDANGNTVTDLNRGIVSSRFDTAGHPARMDFADGSSTSYLYDDAGTKLRTLHRVASVPVAVPGSQGPALTETVTDYCAGFVYEDSTLTRINLDGAYLSYTGADGSRLSTPEYHFYLRDHLSNNRVDVAADGRICQVTDYYPYGLPMASSRNAASQRWLFGGKELDRISGLDLYDFEARAYDPALARFTSPDILSEFAPDHTSYRYCFNNPLRFSDLLGLFETEEAANAYMSEHNINGKVIPSGWGTFLIVDRKRGICYEAGDDTDISSDSHPNDQVVESAYVEGEESKDNTRDYTNDFTGFLFGYAERWYNKHPTSVKSKWVYANTKNLRKLGFHLPSNSTIYREIIPKTLKWGGNIAGAVSICNTIKNCYNSKSVKASDLLDVTVGGISLASGPIGWVIEGIYLSVDITLTLTTHKSIGDYLNEFVEKQYGFKGGALYDGNN